MHKRGTELGGGRGKRTGSALYTSDTQEIDSAALSLGFEARTKRCLPSFELRGGDGHCGTDAKKSGGDEGREVHS